jgi:hypothetical protein
MTLQVGDTVDSIEVGTKEAFTGTIVKVLPFAYHVRDAFNKRWHRSEDELTLVRKA